MRGVRLGTTWEASIFVHLYYVLEVGLALPSGNLAPFSSRIARGEPPQPLTLSPTGPDSGGCWGSGAPSTLTVYTCYDTTYLLVFVLPHPALAAYFSLVLVPIHVCTVLYT